MKVLIICQSVHHGNTAKVAAAMAGELGAAIVKPSEIDAREIGEYDMIGFGSGIYHHSHHRALLDLAERLPKTHIQAFIFSTRGYGRPLPARRDDHRDLREMLEARGFKVTDEFTCKGWSTYYPSTRLFGGLNKNSPDYGDLSMARSFARSLSGTRIIDVGADTMARSFFLRGRKTIIVDTGRPGRHRAILQALETHGISKADVSLILLTHGHEDHTGNVPELAAALGAPVAMGKADAAYIARGLNAPLKPRTLLGRVTTSLVGPKTRAFETDILIDGELDLSAYGVDATAFSTPGHTAGSLSVATPDSCLIGDLLMSRFMVAGAPGMPRLVEVPEAIVPSVKAVLKRNPAVIYPAHGKPWTAEHVRRALSSFSG